MSSYKRSSLRNQKAKLAADYNDLLKELSSREMTSVGCYTIGDTIGEGTYGKVKLGTHKLTGQQVAVKKINKQHASMIAREIHHHRQLEHPNIVRIYEIIVTESSIHIFSEYCPNGELFDLLASVGRFSESRVQRWFQQLASALQLCHRQGIVHRDLKLENILLDINDNCKICDFGFARFTDNKQLLDTFCGSLGYSAPEVIMRQKYTGPETDIWSLGVILYTLLAGELPFDDDSDITAQRKIVNVDYDMPFYFSSDAQDLITHLLKRDPAERWTIDQIINHRWMHTALIDDTTSSHDPLPIGCDEDDEDEDDDDDSSSSTRYSSRSDLDSIFSNPRFKSDLTEEDEDDLVTEASFVSNCSDFNINGKSGDVTQHNINRKSGGSGTTSGMNNHLDGSKFSPQVRFSLGMMRPDDKTKHLSRSPRFSAPTVSSTRSAVSTPFRSSLPLSLPSNRESIRPLSVSFDTPHESSMTRAEQLVASALVSAGFDEQIVQSMRSDTCGTSNTLWKMLMEKQQQQQQQQHYHHHPRHDFSPATSGKQLSSDHARTKTVDAGCQTSSPPSLPQTAVMVDRTTQTSTTAFPNIDKMDGLNTTRTPLPPRLSSSSCSSSSSSAIHVNTSYSSVGYSTANKSSLPSVSSASSSSSERSGWFTSVKSWFGGNQTGKSDYGLQETPLRPSSLWQQNQQHRQQHLVSYRDFDSSPSSKVPSSQGELTAPIYRSGTQKYRRHMLQANEINQLGRIDTPHQPVPSHFDTTPMMLSPPPPTATMSLRPTTDSLSIITTPKYVSSTAVPSHVSEVDICETRNPMYHQPLPPPVPPAAIYTNNSKNSNNRQCYQNEHRLPRQVQQQTQSSQPQLKQQQHHRHHQQQPSPPLTPPDTKPSSTLPTVFPIFNNSIPPSSAASDIKPMSSSSTPALAKTQTATPSSPIPSPAERIKSALPLTPPTLEEGQEKDLINDLRPHSSKSSPALLTSSKVSRRFEFAPRSRLSVYGMNERPSMANKMIIEEEEEEEE